MSNNKIESIQALRALAIVLVVLFHFKEKYLEIGGTNPFFILLSHCGFIGVDYFFVISGFVIYGVVARLDPTAANAARFMRTRMIRIFPFFWMVLPLYVLRNVLVEHRPVDVVGSILLLQPSSVEQIMPVGWSLTYEMAFYIMATVCIVLTTNLGRFLLAYAFVIIFAASIGNDLLLLQPLFLEFCLGALVAWKVVPLIDRIDKTSARYFLALLAVAFAISMIYWGIKMLWKDGEWQSSTFARPLYAGLSGTGWLLAALLVSRCWPKWLSVVSKVGDASFSTYLTHPLTLFACYYVGITAFFAEQGMQTLCAPVLVLICLLVGQLWYGVIERPLYQRLKSKVGQGPGPGTATRPAPLEQLANKSG